MPLPRSHQLHGLFGVTSQASTSVTVASTTPAPTVTLTASPTTVSQRWQRHLDVEFDERDVVHRVGRLERREGRFREPKHRYTECQCDFHTQLHRCRRHGSGKCFRYSHELDATADRHADRLADYRQQRWQQHVDVEFYERDVMHRVGRLERREGGFRKSKHRRVECRDHIHTQLHRCRRHDSGQCFRFCHERDASADRHVVSVADYRQQRWQQHLDVEFYERDVMHRVGRLERDARRPPAPKAPVH